MIIYKYSLSIDNTKMKNESSFEAMEVVDATFGLILININLFIFHKKQQSTLCLNNHNQSEQTN